MCLDNDADGVFIDAFWSDGARGEDLLDASNGGVAFLRPPVSVAGLI